LAILDSEYKEWADKQPELKENLSHYNVRRCLVEWFERLKTSPIPFAPVASEQAFKLEVAPDMFFTGLIDVLGRDRDNGMLVFCDHKTTSALNQAFVVKPGWASQFTGYQFALQHIYGEQVYGCWTNGIDLKSVPSAQKKCPKHGVKYSECGPEHLGHQWIFKQRTEDQLHAWWNSIWGLVQKLEGLFQTVKNPEDLAAVPQEGMFNGECYGYNKCCEFYDFCHRQNKAPEMLYHQTKANKWDPLEGRTVIEGKVG